jgi:hypothetical protein
MATNPIKVRLFLSRMAVVASGIWTLLLLLYLGVSHSLPWLTALGAFLICVLVDLKKSMVTRVRSPMKTFLRSFFVYALPASVLWAFVVLGAYTYIRDQFNYAPPALLATVVTSIGIFTIFGKMLREELSNLGRSRDV